MRVPNTDARRCGGSSPTSSSSDLSPSTSSSTCSSWCATAYSLLRVVLYCTYLLRRVVLYCTYLLRRVVLYCRTDYSLVMHISATAACYCPLLSATASHSSSTDYLAYSHVELPTLLYYGLPTTDSLNYCRYATAACSKRTPSVAAPPTSC